MFTADWAFRFAVALGLGLLLGLEREWAKDEDESTFAGIRTFAMITLTGAVAAFLQDELGLNGLAIGAFAAIGTLIVVSYAVTAAKGEVGMTTEVSALLAFVVGMLCGFGQEGVASAAAVASLLLLALKDYLHRLARRVEVADIYATLKFALISLIILPLLPNETFGPPPIDVINPYKIWWMVVLIAGLNFVGYLLVKVLGNEHGIGLTGVLGGLVSSTAVTLSFSQRSRKEPAQAQAFVLAIVLAWTIMFVRVVVMTAIVYRPLAAPLGVALGMMTIVGIGVSLVLWRRGRSRSTGTVTTGANPFELGEAIKFGLLFGVVTVAAKAAQEYFGETGLYLAGAVAGLTDVDAIALSMANLAATSPDSTAVAARTIVIAVLANTATKTAMAASMGAPKLRRTLLFTTGLLLVAAVIGIVLANQSHTRDLGGLPMTIRQDLIDRFRVPPGKKLKLKDHDPGWAQTKEMKELGKDTVKERAQAILAENLAELAHAQELLYANDVYSVLVCLQAMDAAGKDGTIKHVMTGMNPQGVQVFAFKAPSAEELDHNFLWRYMKALPERGRIGIFNRSYYEDVLVVRVHPELLERQKLPPGKRGAGFWKDRYEDINAFERHLVRNGTVVVKFFLNVSKKEQKQRFLERLDNPEKNWKFSSADLAERGHWDDYVEAFEEALSATSTEWAPWYVVPADNKWITRAVVADLLSSAIEELGLEAPKVPKDKKRELDAARKKLLAE